MSLAAILAAWFAWLILFGFISWPLLAGLAGEGVNRTRVALVGLLGTASVAGQILAISLPFWYTPPPAGGLEFAWFFWFLLLIGMVFVHGAVTIRAVCWLLGRRDASRAGGPTAPAGGARDGERLSPSQARAGASAAILRHAAYPIWAGPGASLWGSFSAAIYPLATIGLAVLLTVFATGQRDTDGSLYDLAATGRLTPEEVRVFAGYPVFGLASDDVTRPSVRRIKFEAQRPDRRDDIVLVRYPGITVENSHACDLPPDSLAHARAARYRTMGGGAVVLVQPARIHVWSGAAHIVLPAQGPDPEALIARLSALNQAGEALTGWPPPDPCPEVAPAP